MISQFAGEYEIELIEHYLREDKTQLKLREGYWQIQIHLFIVGAIDQFRLSEEK